MRVAITAVCLSLAGGGAPPVEAPKPVRIEVRTLDGRVAGHFTGQEAILYCVLRQDDETLRRLLREGHDLNEFGGRDGRAFLHYATFQGTPRAVELLIENGAEVNARTVDGLTSLDVATNRSRNDVVEILRKHGAR